MRRLGFRRLAGVATGLSLALLAPICASASTAPKAAGVSFPAPTWVDTAGQVALSSPVVATINGTAAVVFASENGFVNVVDATSGLSLPGWPEPVDISPGVPTAVESSPTVAYLDGPNRPPSIIVGAGSTYVAHQQGGLVAFNADGSVRFVFQTKDIFDEWSGTSTPHPDGYSEAVFSTPAVGDVTGSGRMDIVFGSYDHRLYALTGRGQMVPGFPIDTEDTIWSSPALVHVRGPSGLEDIFIGGDASGRAKCHGGFVYDFSWHRRALRQMWAHCESQTIWSSPALARIGPAGRPVVVVGTGFGETAPYRPGSDRVYAFDAKSGQRLSGWPVHTAGPVFGSPAIGTVAGQSSPVVVDTSWCLTCTGLSGGASMVYAWAADGTLLWSTQLPGSNDFSSPVLVDLTGSGANDVVVGSSAGLYALDGATGAFMFQSSLTQPINTCSMQNAVAVAYILGSGAGSGWHLFESCGGPRQVITTGRLFDYPLPATPGVVPPWPMWRENPAHTGSSLP